MTNEKKLDFPAYQQKEDDSTLADVIDRVIEKGTSLQGDLVLEVAEIELIYVGLRLVISSAPFNNKSKNNLSSDREEIKRLNKKLREIEADIVRLPKFSSPEKTEKGLAKLVLALIVLLKELMEKEAVRKIDKNELKKRQIQKLGITFQILDKKIEELKKVFGIKEDLNLDLGPLGKLR